MFETLQGLLYHYADHRNAERPRYFCITCIGEFSTEEELLGHKRILRCEVCGDTFRCNYAHRLHMNKRSCKEPSLAINSFYFSLLFVRGSLIFWALSFLPAAHLFRAQTLDGLFKLTRCPSRALNLASCISSGTTE